MMAIFINMLLDALFYILILTMILIQELLLFVIVVRIRRQMLPSKPF